jgi:hypothetical protein
VGLVIATTALAACEIEWENLSPRTSQQVVHGVLSATSFSQVVLLEKTLTGERSVFTVLDFDPGDPIVSSGGIASIDATVDLLLPSGETIRAREDRTVRSDGKGSGVYRFPLQGSRLERGRTYRLKIRTADGVDVAAWTTMPQGTPVTMVANRTFDRSRDTALLQWPAVPQARAYAVRIESPYGPVTILADSPRVRLTGELRHVSVDGFPRVFLPGFRQVVTVSAIDSNLYDYYRSANASFNGSGIINRVQGGLGVFGSLVRIGLHGLQVVVPQEENLAGSFHFLGTAFEEEGAPARTLVIYTESKARREGQAHTLSGSFEGRPFGSGGFVGEMNGSRVGISLLSNQLIDDTLNAFVGELRGDTLDGRWTSGAPATFVRRR